MAEIAFEYLAGVHETTKGTAVTPPDHYLNMKGKIKPMRERYKAPNIVGSLAQNRRGAILKKWGELEAAGDMDGYVLPWIANMVLKGGVTAPTTPPTAVLSRLWTFQRAMLADNLRSATFYDGDPNVKIWQAKYGMLDELTINSDPGASSEAVQMGIKGHTHFPTKLVSAPAEPTLTQGPLFVPGLVQVWADTTLAIGTTEIIGRVLKASHTIPTGVTYKYPGQGPTSGLNYHHNGRVQSECTTELSMDMLDTTEYDLYEGAEQVKLRVRHNGPLIEDISGTKFYHYVQVDMYGTLDDLDWGDYEGNRTLDLTLFSEENVVAGTDCILYVQSTRTTL